MKNIVRLFLVGMVLVFCSGLVFAAPTLDTEALAKNLNKGRGWDKKDKTAVEYKSADHKYRTYTPTTSKTSADGLFVSTKINHIRGFGGDDYCILELTFDSKGKLISERGEIVFGNKKFDTGILTTAAEGNKEVEVGAKVFNKLADQVAAWGESGGRKNFPAVVKHNANWIAAAVKP